MLPGRVEKWRGELVVSWYSSVVSELDTPLFESAIFIRDEVIFLP